MINLDITTEINCQRKRVEVRVDSEDSEPFLDGVWDMDGKEIVLDDADEQRVLYDVKMAIEVDRSDWAAHVMEDWTGS